MRTILYYGLIVLLIAMVVPLTVFANGNIREVGATVDSDNRLTVEVTLSGLGRNGGGLTSGEDRVEVEATARFAASCSNPAGNEPRNTTFPTSYWDAGFVILDVANDPGLEHVSVVFEPILDTYEAMCSEDHEFHVDEFTWLYGQVTLVRGGEGLDVVNLSIND